jgi:hypothetical protein
MTMTTITCRRCGQPYEAEAMIGEQSAVGPSGDIAGVSRMFRATCPEHGPILGHRMGTHSTLVEVQWAKRLSRAQRQRLYDALEGEELRQFKDARRGKHFPRDEQKARWLQIAGDDESV